MNIILTTMVKNESKIIQRMLDSCLPIATHYVVVDTGSTDKTREIAKLWGQKNRKPLCVFRTQFKDFGTTRTFTLGRAKEYAKELHLDLADTYLLLLDADMMLQANSFLTKDLSADMYRLEQMAGNVSYWNPRLLKASASAQYFRRTHEYLGGSTPPTDLFTLRILDLGDGGCKADKFIRDEKLLKEDLQEMPNDPRTLYYLGQTLEALGKKQEACIYYQLRVKAGDWDEEQWLAQYRMAMLTPGEEGDKELEKAFLMRPWRAEALHALCERLLDRKQQRRACALAQMGLSIPFPKGERLFVNRKCYSIGFSSVLSIGSFYCGDMYDGMKHCDVLRLSKDSPFHHSVLKNVLFYLKKLPGKTADIPFEPDPFYHMCNPSMLSITEKTVGVCIRTVNYLIDTEGRYTMFGPQAPNVHSTSWWTVWSLNDAGLDKCLSKTRLDNFYTHEARIKGMEDIRVFSYKDGVVRALATCLDYVEGGGKPRIHDVSWDATGKVIHCVPLSDASKIEKNWLPLPLSKGPPSFIYSHNPFRIGSFDTTGQISWRLEQKLPFDASDFRGGCSPVRDSSGAWVWMVHEIIIPPGQTKRVYMHRFVAADPAFSRIIATQPFFLDHKGIEFCSGMVAFKDGFLLGFGNEDNKACTMFVSEKLLADLFSRSVTRIPCQPSSS